MRDLTQGRPFHGEFTSADASALSESASRFTLYSAGTTPASITLAANERVVITDIQVASDAAVTFTIYDGPNNAADAGEKIVRDARSVADATYIQSLQVPHYCQVGPTNGYPKVLTSAAGQIDAVIRGIIVRDGQ